MQYLYNLYILYIFKRYTRFENCTYEYDEKATEIHRDSRHKSEEISSSFLLSFSKITYSSPISMHTCYVLCVSYFWINFVCFMASIFIFSHHNAPDLTECIKSNCVRCVPRFFFFANNMKKFKPTGTEPDFRVRQQ